MKQRNSPLFILFDINLFPPKKKEKRIERIKILFVIIVKSRIHHVGGDNTSHLEDSEISMPYIPLLMNYFASLWIGGFPSPNAYPMLDMLLESHSLKQFVANTPKK